MRRGWFLFLFFASLSLLAVAGDRGPVFLDQPQGDEPALTVAHRSLTSHAVDERTGGGFDSCPAASLGSTFFPSRVARLVRRSELDGDARLRQRRCHEPEQARAPPAA
jgi:hypothetical protein